MFALGQNANLPEQKGSTLANRQGIHKGALGFGCKGCTDLKRWQNTRPHPEWQGVFRIFSEVYPNLWSKLW